MFETVTPPPETVLLPGVISHATNIVEHPEVIAEFEALAEGARRATARLW